MDDGWIEVLPADLVQARLGRVLATGGSVDLADAVSILFALPETQGVLRVDGDQAAGLNQFVPGTRIFFNAPRAKEIGWDVITAASVFAATGSTTLTTAVGIAQRAVRTFKLLDEDEMDVVLVMRGLCGSRDPAFTTITFEQLKGVYEGTQARPANRLRSLEKKGVLVRTDTGWRLLP
jgi:hypothetical protein